jgi:hypothetical protein
VDVFGADFSAGVAWLFSAHALQSIRYAALENPACYVGIDFELGDDVQGTLRLRYRQQLEWIDTPIFELRTPDPEESEYAAS